MVSRRSDPCVNKNNKLDSGKGEMVPLIQLFKILADREEIKHNGVMWLDAKGDYFLKHHFISQQIGIITILKNY